MIPSIVDAKYPDRNDLLRLKLAKRVLAIFDILPLSERFRDIDTSLDIVGQLYVELCILDRDDAGLCKLA